MVSKHVALCGHQRSPLRPRSRKSRPGTRPAARTPRAQLSVGQPDLNKVVSKKHMRAFRIFCVGNSIISE